MSPVGGLPLTQQDTANADDAPPPKGFMLVAPGHHAVARQAFERTARAPSDTSPDQVDARVAVLFAAASLESFITELPRTAAAHGPQFKGAARLQWLVDLLCEAEEARVNVQFKFLLTKVILTGDPYVKGAHPYQDFDLLIKVRNALLHLKSPEFTMGADSGMPTMLHPKTLRSLQTRGLVQSQSKLRAWVHMISTRGVARWACNTAVDMVMSIQESFGKDWCDDFIRKVVNGSCSQFLRVPHASGVGD